METMLSGLRVSFTQPLTYDSRLGMHHTCDKIRVNVNLLIGGKLSLLFSWLSEILRAPVLFKYKLLKLAAYSVLDLPARKTPY